MLKSFIIVSPHQIVFESSNKEGWDWRSM